MSEGRIHDLKRRVDADPADAAAQLELLIMRGRVEGAGVYLEPLQDLIVWKNSPSSIQDLAIEAVDRGLGESFQWLRTESYECVESFRLATFGHRRIPLEFQLIPAGRFHMGTAVAEQDAYADEYPRHEVHIRHALLVGRTPVTNKAWLELEASGEIGNAELPRHPVTGVSWDATQVWLEELGDGFRLPSESEWEYFCRANTSTRYFWGNDAESRYSWYSGHSSEPMPTHLHIESANAFGLIDVSGNVWEWCEDQCIQDYVDGPVNELARVNAAGSDSDMRMARGGSYENGANCARSAHRGWRSSSDESRCVGFRVVKTITSDTCS